MAEQYQRVIPFENILNFRDLGGYKTRDGRMIAWRRLFRSGEIHHMTRNDVSRLLNEIRVKTVIDLRRADIKDKAGEGLLEETSVQIIRLPCAVADNGDTGKRNKSNNGSSGSAEADEYKVTFKDDSRSLINAMEVIADRKNHPVVFHCNAGKYRSGIMSALILSVFSVTEKDIIDDYSLSDRYMKAFIDRWSSDPGDAEFLKGLPDYHLRAMPESMILFLKILKQDYGSAEGYLKTQGADKTLIERLKNALLV